MIIAARLGTKDNEKREYLVKKIAAAIGRVDTSKTPAHTTTFLREIRILIGGDPFKNINDSTRQDANETHLTETCRIIDNGSDAAGTILEWTPERFQRDFENASLVVSKGQGNFETSLTSQKRIFFLFQSKCDAVSTELGLSKGSMLLKKS